MMLNETSTHAVLITEVKRVLVVKLASTSDVLLMTPVLSVLKTANPRCDVDVLTYQESVEVLQDNPDIAEIHTIPTHHEMLGLEELKIKRQLFSALVVRRYDLIVLLSVNAFTLQMVKKIRPRWSVAPTSREYQRILEDSVTHIASVPPGSKRHLRHAVEKNLDVLRRIGLQPNTDRKLKIYPGERAYALKQQLLSGTKFTEGQYIHLHAGSSQRSKCLSAIQLTELIDALLSRNEKILLTSSAHHHELELVDYVTTHLKSPRHIIGKNLLNIAGQLTFRDLAALVKTAKIFIGVNSTPMHIASAQDTPVITFFGPNSEHEFHPWQVPYIMVTSKKHSCRPCHLDGCGGGKISECLTQLSLEQILQSIDLMNQKITNTFPINIVEHFS